MAAPRRLAVLLTGAALIAGPALLMAGTTTAQAGPYDDPTMDLPRKTSPYEGVGPSPALRRRRSSSATSSR